MLSGTREKEFLFALTLHHTQVLVEMEKNKNAMGARWSLRQDLALVLSVIDFRWFSSNASMRFFHKKMLSAGECSIELLMIFSIINNDTISLFKKFERLKRKCCTTIGSAWTMLI